MKLDELNKRAQNVMVKGVSASGRYHAILNKSLLLQKADGCIMTDVDGVEWIDYHNESGAGLLGFNNPKMKEALLKALEMGNINYMETEYNLCLAEKISSMVPSAEKVRLCNSGTEATLHAIRLARGYNKKKKIIKFEGHFHGMHELIFYNWRDKIGDILPEGNISLIRGTDGMVDEFDQLVVVLPWNNIEILQSYVQNHKDEISAIICEPIMFNAGCIEPKPGFLEGMRKIADENDVVLIFDEVLSGFRLHKGGAQGYYGITPDITALSKALGSGMTIAAVVGKNHIMRELTPVGKVQMSGTYSGSSLNVLGALAALEIIDQPNFYPELTKHGEYFFSKIDSLFKKTGLTGHVQGLCSRFGLFFGVPGKVWDIRESALNYRSDAGYRFVELALKHHLYFHYFGNGVVPMHCGITSEHTFEILDYSLNIIEEIFSQMVDEGF